MKETSICIHTSPLTWALCNVMWGTHSVVLVRWIIAAQRFWVWNPMYVHFQYPWAICLTLLLNWMFSIHWKFSIREAKTSYSAMFLMNITNIMNTRSRLLSAHSSSHWSELWTHWTVCVLLYSVYTSKALDHHQRPGSRTVGFELRTFWLRVPIR